MGVEVADDERTPDKLVGQVLANRYQIEARLGEGAMGAVYRARHVKVGRPFAVKVLHSRLTMDNKVLLRFEREAELAGRLRHPNVIGVVDVGEMPDGTRYMVMDFAEGPDLASLLSEAPMPPHRIIRIVRQMLEGLYHAHEHGLIHRDFKPENVIVERDTHGDEVPRIVDFGIAILREGSDATPTTGRLTTNGLVLGTPHYMAPEQAVADPIDHRIDLFALGIIVYEMLSGKLPFDGSGAEVARANLLLDPPRISDRVPYLEVDPLLEAFARRLMAKKRDHRPATAKAARDILDLIDRDRAAAAPILGVPVEIAARAPLPTQPSKPVSARNDHPGTFPPPMREFLETPPQAPRMGAAVAVPASTRRDAQNDVTTQPASPLPFEAKRSRRPILITAAAGVGAIAIAAALKLGTGSSAPPAPVATTAKPDIRPIETVEPKPTEIKPVQAPVEEPGATHPPDTNPTETHRPDTNPAETNPSGSKPNDTKATSKGSKAKQIAKSHDDHKVEVAKPTETKPAEIKPAEIKPPETKPAEIKPPETKPAEIKPAETKPAESIVAVKPADDTKPLDAKGLVRVYSATNADLRALEAAKGVDEAAELRARYRLINIQQAMATQMSRDQASAALTKIRREIAAKLR
ncbi:MAG: serine/threonine protein kinase [Myxococcales bacterium]|nr:serine/threonine protein kinase [Myxococcales bacterium]